MYVCHMRSPPGEIAEAFGVDRTTVSHACHVVEDRRDVPASTPSSAPSSGWPGGLPIAGRPA
jgi:hypothetical protein